MAALKIALATRVAQETSGQSSFQLVTCPAAIVHVLDTPLYYNESPGTRSRRVLMRTMAIFFALHYAPMS